MKILFVSSGNSDFGISPIVRNQGESIERLHNELDYFTIQGKGLLGYLKNISALKQELKNKYDIVHAHYSLSGIVASMAGARPLVVSLMGSDVHVNKFYKVIIRIFNVLFWNKTIVKSKIMGDTIFLKNSFVIPNGVNSKKFRPIDRKIALAKTKWNSNKKHILFAADPDRPVKNYSLATNALKLIARNGVEMHELENIPNDRVLYFYNAADLLLLTSFREGSPNVIKEAMACNIPIVSTDVGDVKEVVGETKGCYITSFNPNDVAGKIELSLKFGKRTNGRKAIEHLEDSTIGHKIIGIYYECLPNDEY